MHQGQDNPPPPDEKLAFPQRELAADTQRIVVHPYGARPPGSPILFEDSGPRPGEGPAAREQAPGEAVPPDTGSDSGSFLPTELRDHPRYAILKKLGEGGMGAVYQAEHRLMGRIVALKVINPWLVGDALAVARFRQEMQTAARLAHPNIVTAHDAEQVGNCHLLVMEYVEGVNLSRLIGAMGPLLIDRTCDFLRQVALGLQHAHEQGMVHRDVKPQNLMVTSKGQVKILDFGLARFASEQVQIGKAALAEGITRAGEVLGTPDFLAPEQARDARGVDARADLYALGCTAFFLLTGRVPFPAASSIDTLMLQCQADPPPIATLRPEVPPALVHIVRKLMAKKPEDRYQTAAEVADALAPFAQAHALAPVPPPVTSHHPLSTSGGPPLPGEEPALLPPTRRGVLAFAAVAVGLGLLAGAAFAIIHFGTFSGRENKGASTADSASPGRTLAKKTGPRVFFLLASQQASFAEYDPVRQALEQGGVEVVLVSSTSDPVRFDDKPGKGVQPDLLVGEVQASDSDALVVGGGPGVREYTGAPDQAAAARRLIAAMMQTRKPVAALGTGTAVLADAGVLRGKRVTCAATVRDAVARDGGEVVAEAMVALEPGTGHGYLLTSRDPAAAPELARSVLRALQK